MVKGFVLRADTGAPSPGAGGRILANASQTQGEFSLLLSNAPAGDGAPLHVHDRESESFFVLAGSTESGAETTRSRLARVSSSTCLVEYRTPGP